MFATISKQSLADAVFQQLSERILQGQLPPGEMLPAERILAEQLGINRGAVREGLKRLQQAALVVIRHGGATQVLDWRENAGLELLPELLLSADGELNVEAAQGIMLLRSTLAPAIAAAAAAQPDETLAQSLESHCQTLADATNASERQSAALSFWSCLVSGSGNIAYRLAFNSMHRTYAQIQDLLTEILDVEFRDIASLQGIAQAIRQGDPAMAAQQATSHVSKGETAVMSAIAALSAQRR